MSTLPLTAVPTPTCPQCNQAGAVEVIESQYWAWKNEGMLIQVAFPDMPAPLREQLKTGYHPVCWDMLFN
jgi:hypothetical protein